MVAFVNLRTVTYKLNNKGCIVCGTVDDLTDEHLPPKGLFPSFARDDLLIVNACRACNKSWSKEDEYFRDVLVDVMASVVTSDALDEMRVTVARAEARRVSMGLRPKLYTLGPTPWGQLAPRLDRGAIAGTMCRTLIALHWWHTGARLPSACEVCADAIFGFDYQTRDAIASWLTSRPVISLGRGLLKYSYELDAQDPRLSHWALILHHDVFFIGSTLPPGGGPFHSPILNIDYGLEQVPKLSRRKFTTP